MELVCCGCKAKCETRRCSCVKNDVQCTYACACGDDCVNCDSTRELVDEDDDWASSEEEDGMDGTCWMHTLLHTRFFNISVAVEVYTCYTHRYKYVSDKRPFWMHDRVNWLIASSKSTKYTHMKNEGSGAKSLLSGFFPETRLPCSPRFGKNRLIKFKRQNTSFNMCASVK